MTGENGNGELLIFEMDSNDRVKRVKVGENFIYPVLQSKSQKANAK